MTHHSHQRHSHSYHSRQQLPIFCHQHHPREKEKASAMPSLVSLHWGLRGGFHPKFAMCKPNCIPSKTWSSLEAAGGGGMMWVFLMRLLLLGHPSEQLRVSYPTPEKATPKLPKSRNLLFESKIKKPLLATLGDSIWPILL